MGVLKGIGYAIAAVFVFAVLLAGGVVVSALVSLSGFVLVGAAAIAAIALLIQECCEHETKTACSSADEKGDA